MSYAPYAPFARGVTLPHAYNISNVTINTNTYRQGEGIPPCKRCESLISLSHSLPVFGEAA
jgi:hypothetical protein